MTVILSAEAAAQIRAALVGTLRDHQGITLDDPDLENFRRFADIWPLIEAIRLLDQAAGRATA
jgi:hypothetical protein